MANPNPPANGFKKGDPRINRKGRPKTLDEVRALAQQIAHEPLHIGDKRITVIEAILRQWAQSKNPKLQELFVQYAYGKVKDSVDLTSGGAALQFLIKERDADN